MLVLKLNGTGIFCLGSLGSTCDASSKGEIVLNLYIFHLVDHHYSQGGIIPCFERWDWFS